MPRLPACAVVALCGWFAGCSGSRPVEEARPVATPSVTVGSKVAASGRPLEYTLRFQIAADAPPFQEDYTVFVHFVDDGERIIGADDHEPPTPTRQWKAGSTVEYRRSTYAPTSTYVGEAAIVVGLYSRSSGERVPLAGEAIEPRAIKVGSFEMHERADPYAVVFREGWHSPESPEASGLQWRWSMKSGALSFPNPNRDAELVLQLDQPNDVFPTPQHVEVRVGESVVDSFDLEPGPGQVRKISLSRGVLGSSPNVELAVVSDKTFVPAQVAALRSSDSRQLGVRVFRVYIEPKQ